ncbi:aldose 1-epimerase family protein [Shewanella submarina]|uniref:Aldose 1-epimerase family protein n=1 Tax=Shewanella submarina TaxID=2016376 RepID=A0ABV7GJ03_9GAMM|nr:aldose 1-epimerase family protein [Shewanella submarina]MCL1035840.1 aldose 1-epimerase family protein [Shewanella submarina]
MFTLPLYKHSFSRNRSLIARSDAFEIYTFVYNSGVEAVEIRNSKGHLVVLPFMGQMVWDAEFLGTDLCMKNMFSEPKLAKTIVETYGCFAFHAGMIRMGCPTPQDDHVLHGEMPCATMDSAWLEISDTSVTIKGSYEYVMGFGDHYLATPSVTLGQDSGEFDIQMTVKNLASVPMPLQYMCHINAAYLEGAVMSQNLPDEAFVLRQSVPDHVRPTEQWLAYNETLKTSAPFAVLDEPQMHDPEIVYFADDISRFTERAELSMAIGDKCLITEFDTKEFNNLTRWVLYNGDQQVAAYALPATCRPEGFLAARESGNLLYLEPGETRHFSVRTGIRQA